MYGQSTIEQCNKYPYMTGCFGLGNYPNIQSDCTTNPAKNDMKLFHTPSFSSSLTVTTRRSHSHGVASSLPKWQQYSYRERFTTQ
ncbi:unnamed protein product [Adineta ricciae]|uniref:Uncharacterized protein n=1 Tax=Adineta ricciae TaxID=249248 RepID=A0A815FGQ3_ADIRI|nr:unnamed protein product [Adineta ricciae]CAF1653553.1 unnamed protein product [Adineta ricciae]